MKLFRRYLYRHLHHLVPLPILAAAFIGWLAEPAVLAQFRLNVFDEYIRLRPRQYEPTPVRIIDIDDDSLQRFGQWPWPRTLLAQLVDRLNEMGAAVMPPICCLSIPTAQRRRASSSTPRTSRPTIRSWRASRRCPITTRSSPTRSSAPMSCSASRCATRKRASSPGGRQAIPTSATTPGRGSRIFAAPPPIYRSLKPPRPATPFSISCRSATASRGAPR